MNIEMLPGLDNVVRFPIEQRLAPSIDVVGEIAPDCREVARVAESFMLEAPDPELFNQVDAETALYIAEHIRPLSPAERGVALTELLNPLVKRAVEACRDMDRVSKQSVQAEQRLHRAQVAGSSTLWPLVEAADALANRVAELLLLAHARCQEAHGAHRAIGLALRDEPWAPHSMAETTAWLVGAELAHRARTAVRVG